MKGVAVVQDPADIEQICKFYGETMRFCDIEAYFKDNHPNKYPTLDHHIIRRIVDSPANKTKIDKYRQFYLANPMDVDIANKRVRLEDLNKERVRIINTIESQFVDKKNGTIKEKKFRTYLYATKRLIELEIAGRDEVEKKPDLLEAFGRIGPLADMTDEELVSYERSLTIKLTAFKSGLRVQKPLNAEIAGRPGIESSGNAKPA